jgi:hypothetical protein
MSGLDKSGATLEEPAKQRSVGSRLGDLGDRLARAFATLDPPRTGPSTPESNGSMELTTVADTAPGRRNSAAPFPIVRRGYDHAAVDRHLADLERELAELRAGSPSVTAEIERIGENTAEILTLAHEKARETTHSAQVEADNCLANAASNAIEITEDAKRQLAEIDSETDAVWRERARLIEDTRSVAAALFSLAEEASERFAAEPERGELPAEEDAATSELPGEEFVAAAEPPTPVFAPEPSE